jgi:multidrug transporter EmrE-like cation transporter
MSHVCKEYMNIIKWLGTILCLAGIGLTSFNIYPINIVLSLIGSVLWTFAGWAQKDTPLFLVELVAVIFYIAGIITLFN